MAGSIIANPLPFTSRSVLPGPAGYRASFPDRPHPTIVAPSGRWCLIPKALGNRAAGRLRAAGERLRHLSVQQNVVLRFGDCRLDIESRQLVHGGEEEHLSPKAFDLLVALLEARPRVLSKETLLERIWPDVFVSEANLAVLVAEVREAIGDSARAPALIKTHHGVGYSFKGQVEELSRGSLPPSEGPTVALQVGPRRIVLRQGTISAGRDELSDVVLHDPSVSRHHARLFVDGSRVTVEDLGSKNGTRVNGVPVTEATAVGHGTDLMFGDLVASVVVEEGSTDTTWTIVTRPEH